MSNLLQNMLVLGFCWLLAAGGGIYVTYVKQPAELERLSKAEKVAQMKEEELSALSTEVLASEHVSEEITTRWNARYKVVPKILGPEEVIDFLNQHTKQGFDPFDITFRGMQEGEDVNSYVFAISGKGYFTNLYRLIWELENNQQFYRVHNLDLDHINLTTTDRLTKRPRLDVAVDFTFEVEAYYGGLPGLSRTDALTDADSQTEPGQSIDTEPTFASIPADVLPLRNPPLNPFYPIIMEQIPPNTNNQVNIESATLLGIVDNQGVFAWDNREVKLGIGDPVYLGQIISVDPEKGTVTARLNKGGIMDRVDTRVGVAPSAAASESN